MIVFAESRKYRRFFAFLGLALLLLVVAVSFSFAKVNGQQGIIHQAQGMAHSVVPAALPGYHAPSVISHMNLAMNQTLGQQMWPTTPVGYHGLLSSIYQSESQVTPATPIGFHALPLSDSQSGMRLSPTTPINYH